MYTYDVIQIVDAYPRHHEEGRGQTMKTDPDEMAQSLSMLIKSLGRNDRKIALVARDDERRQFAYQRAGYETHPMNGDRRAELMRFIQQMTAQIKQTPPKHLVLVSDDPEFSYLCEAVVAHTGLTVWANSATVPPVLTEPSYGFRPLEDLLPNLKIARIDVRLDLENIFIGLVKRGWKPSMNDLIQAIRQTVEDLGEVVSVTGYADFDELNRHHGGQNLNWQRELTLAGGESRYVVNQHGKNTADMKIADDIRTLVEHSPNAGSAIDVIALATMDRDFRTIAETARGRGKKVVVLGLQGGLSRELGHAASEVRFLDPFLKLAQQATHSVLPEREEAALMMQIVAWMNRNRWRFVFRDRLEQEFGGATASLRKLIADSWLVPAPNSSLDPKGQARMLEPNPNNQAARAAQYLARWITGRVDFCLRQKGMPHVDSNFLANGMTRDQNLIQLGIGQTRADAETWLHAAAMAGLVVATVRPHPQKPEKLITTWHLPEEAVVARAATVKAEAKPEVKTKVTNEASGVTISAVTVTDRTAGTPSLAHLRQLLTRGLDDNEMDSVLLDDFAQVHWKIQGSPKYAKVQALLEYVERHNEYEKLLVAIRDKNESLFEGTQERLLAA